MFGVLDDPGKRGDGVSEFLTKISISSSKSSVSPVISHAGSFIVVATATKFVHVFEIVNAKTNFVDAKQNCTHENRRIRHALVVRCYDVVVRGRISIPTETGSDVERDRSAGPTLVLVTRGGDFLSLRHCSLDRRSSKKRKASEDDIEDDAPQTIEIKPGGNNNVVKFHACPSRIVGFHVLPNVDQERAGNAFAVIERDEGKRETNIRIVTTSGNVTTWPFPALSAVSGVESVNVLVLVPRRLALSRRRAGRDGRTSDHVVIENDVFERLTKLLTDQCQGENKSQPTPSNAALIMYAFDSGRIFWNLYDLDESNSVARKESPPPALFFDCGRRFVHFGVVSDSGNVDGSTSTDAVNDGFFFYGVTATGGFVKLGFDGGDLHHRDLHLAMTQSKVALPDAPVRLSSFLDSDLFFCSNSYFYVVDQKKIADSLTVSAFDTASSRLFAHAGFSDFCVIRDSDFHRVPDLLFFLDARGNIYLRRLSGRGGDSSGSPILNDFRQMSNSLSAAAVELTARKRRAMAADRALNTVLETLAVCGHLKTACPAHTGSGSGTTASDEAPLRVEYDLSRRDYGDSRSVELELTLMNDSETYVFCDGWAWSVAISGKSSPEGTPASSSSSLKSIPLNDFRPGQFRKISIPVQALGLDVSNALKKTLQLRVSISFCYSTFLEHLQKSCSDEPSLTNLRSDTTLFFPIFRQDLDFLDLMHIEWKLHSTTSPSLSDATTTTTIQNATSTTQEEGIGCVDYSLLAERLVDEIADTKMAKLLLSPEMTRKTQRRWMEPTPNVRRYETRLNLSPGTISSLGLTSENRMNVVRDVAKIIFRRVKLASDAGCNNSNNNNHNGKFVLQEPFSGHECELALGGKERSNDEDSLAIDHLNLTSGSPALLIVVRQLVMRRIKANNNNNTVAESDVKDALSKLDWVEREMRKVKSATESVDGSLEALFVISKLVIRSLETDLDC